MDKILNYVKEIMASSSLKKKILFTIMFLILYRFLVIIPVPFVMLDQLDALKTSMDEGLSMFSMLLGGSLQKFSIIAVGLIPFINASIIMQLLSAVVPQLEELQEQGEVGTMKIQSYTRWLTLPLAFVQSIGMVYFINSMAGNVLIDQTNFSVVLLSAFSLTVGTVMLMWIGEMITEKGVTNGVSLIIFSSIVAGISSSISGVFGGSGDGNSQIFGLFTFMLVIVLVLVVLSVLLIKTKKEIPIIYSRQGSREETASLPIPLNPVGMIPIIFAIAFTSFPYLLSKILEKMDGDKFEGFANFISNHFNIYGDSGASSPAAIIFYFVLIVLFTFFYAMIMYNPDRIADNIQKRGGFIPGIRPGEETAKYINKVLMHLCFWGGIGLGIIGIYTYILYYIPFIKDLALGFSSLPVIVSGAGVIIIVGVVQDIVNKVNAELLMERYDRF